MKEDIPKKFQVTIGGKTAYIEIISLQNHICAVEFAGHEPIFITRVKDNNNKYCWISLPQDNNELASSIGPYIDERLYSNDSG